MNHHQNRNKAFRFAVAAITISALALSSVGTSQERAKSSQVFPDGIPEETHASFQTDAVPVEPGYATSNRSTSSIAQPSPQEPSSTGLGIMDSFRFETPLLETDTAIRPASDYAHPAGVEFAPVVDTTDQPQPSKFFGEFLPGGRGFQVAKTPYGELNLSAWTYIRYINQDGLDNSYTDFFGRTTPVIKREDIQVNKLMLYFKGWVYDPRLNYIMYAWTANTSQGESAQVALAGSLSWVFNDHVTGGAGINSLPGTRSLRNTFPYWLAVDHRPMSEEFFRPSFTTGAWLAGKITDRVQYRVMTGNNNSQLGVNASRLPGGLPTFSGSIWWMPTTGEFGPAIGYGDFQEHEVVATLFGTSFTTSRETKQSQPGTEDLHNSQIRLSDGTNVFSTNAFNTGGTINELDYNMLAVDAGMKYQGYALDGEYYFRWLGDFETIGSVPVTSLYDHGFQVQASKMLLPKTLQPFVIGNKILGQYGDPWSVVGGVNWYPTGAQLFRVNLQVDYLNRSPVGNNAFPYPVGATGTVYQANVELFF